MYAQKARHQRIKIYSIEKRGNSPEAQESGKKRANAARKSARKQRRNVKAWKRKRSRSKHANWALMLPINIRDCVIRIDVPFQIFEANCE
jgi:hypothetical protein